MSDVQKITDSLDEFGEVFSEFREHHVGRLDELKTENESLRERIESLEQGHATRGTIGKKRKRDANYRKLQGQGAYEVKRGQRFEDVPAFHSQDDVGLNRLLGAMALGSDCGDVDAVKKLNELKSVQSGTSGVTLDAATAAQWVDRVRAQSVVFRAGARSVSMPTATFSYIHVTNDPDVTWRSAEGASLSASDPGFAARQLVAKTAATRVQLSLEAGQDIADAGRQIADVITRAQASAIDSMAFIGSGSGGEPTGLLNLSGVGTVTSVGTPTNWDEVVDGVASYLNANNTLDDLTGICMHPNVWQVYAKLKTGISSDNTPLELPPSIAEVPKFVSTGCDAVESPEDYHISLGNFEDLLIGFRMDPTVRILDATTSMASNLLIEIVGVMRVDIVALRPASFVRLEDVTTT